MEVLTDLSPTHLQLWLWENSGSLMEKETTWKVTWGLRHKTRLPRKLSQGSHARSQREFVEGVRGWEQLGVISGEVGCLLVGDCGAVVCSPSVRWKWYLSPWRPFIGSVHRVCLQLVTIEVMY